MNWSGERTVATRQVQGRYEHCMRHLWQWCVGRCFSLAPHTSTHLCSNAQNFLPGEPKAIAILDAYFGSKPAPAAAGAAAHASSERSTGSTAAGNGSAGAGSAGAQDQQAPDGMRQYHKGSSGPDVTEYRAANEAKQVSSSTSVWCNRRVLNVWAVPVKLTKNPVQRGLGHMETGR